MDKRIKVLLGSNKNIRSTNTDIYDRIIFSNDTNVITEYNVNEEINSSDQFNIEREENESYRIYGRIEWMSMLNGVINNYDKLKDFFYPKHISTSKNILNSFNVYLVRPSSLPYDELVKTNDDTLYEHKYNRLFEVIATSSDLNLYPVGFNKNIFNEQVYGFNFNRNFDIRNVVDGLGMPITDFYMFLQYKTSVNGNGVRETIQYIDYNTNYNTDGSYFVDDLVMKKLNIGDIIKTVDNRCISDRIGYNKSEYYQEIINDQIFYITTECKRPDNNNSVNIKWKYNPFIPIKLRYLSDEVYEANTGDTSYETTSIIPNYAISIDDHGNYVWREVFQEGFIDPLSNKGNDFPFMNGNRYVFNNIVFSIQPELKDPNTKSIFNNIWFDRDSEKIKIKPISSIKDIGKPCR